MPRLADFAARFAGRFAELMFDTDEGVAAVALRLQARLVQHGVLKHEVGGGVGVVVGRRQAGCTGGAALGLAALVWQAHCR